MDVEDAIKIWNVFWATAPLTVSSALIYLGIVKKWFNQMWAFQLLLMVGIPLYIALELGLPSAPEKLNINQYGGTMLGRVFSIFHEYLNVYGGFLVLFSLLVGLWIGRAWEHLAIETE